MGRRRNVYLLSALLAAFLIFPWGLTQPLLLDDLRNFVFDSFQRAAPRQYDRDAPVRVVGVDDESLAVFGQWPWPRTRLAELTNKLAELGAAAIVFDFIFAEPDRMSFENIVGSSRRGALGVLRQRRGWPWRATTPRRFSCLSPRLSRP